MRIPLVSRLSFVLCYWIYLCLNISLVSSQCLEDQRSLLLQLKNNLSLPYEYSSGKLVSWNQNTDCCEWKGISCDNQGHVAGLDLSEENISGEINSSSSLFDLQYLQNLNLAQNNFSCMIPSGIQKLRNLICLNMSYAGFVGQIPIEISHLTRLVSLDISIFSYVTGQELKLENPNLQMLVQNLTGLRKLYLDGVNISAKGQEWCGALLSLPNLQELSIIDSALSGPIDSLARLEHLSVIHLDGNNLSSPVPEAFAYFKNLTTLSLSGCSLGGIFPQKIFQVRTLSFIDISDNDGLHGSLPDFPLNGSLKTLIVSSTNFSGPIPNSISNLRQLSMLDLSSCQFNGTLPSSLSKLTQLVQINLSNNRFTGPIPSLSNYKKLVGVILSGNYFTGSIPSTHFEGLLSLVDIYLSDNSFTGRIPSSMFVLPSLLNIQLSYNQFDGQMDDIVNSSSRVRMLDLSSNRLEGPIPLSVFQLRELWFLELSSNKFNGEIELNMIQNLKNLATLELSYNNLLVIDAKTAFPISPKIETLGLASCKLTAFPQLLKNQSELKYLDLSNNHLAGTIPDWLSKLSWLSYLNLSHNYLTDWEEPLLNNMSDLSVLDLHFNHMQGSLPVLPQRLSFLDYSDNNLSSCIPPNFGSYLSVIRYLSFSSNNLVGNIPESLCNVPYLEVLDLSNNSLNGTIPKCLFAMNRTLSILNLGRNKLTGTINTFPDSCNLRTLNLNGNFLQGKLPKYPNFIMVEIFDLGNNQIDDQFSCWLKSIPTMHVLILRSNNLHGSLTCLGGQAAWPYLQIIDLASNNFSGIVPPTFFGTLKAMISDENDKNLAKLDYLQFRYSVDITVYYQDRVTVTSKNLKMELVKIQTIFTAIDLSNNKLEGPIPKELGQLRALHILNLSRNAFCGHIPSSVGTLKLLESLDMSNNSFSGEIPSQIANLSSLSILNLSYNHLVGRIPSGTQIQTFEASSFLGNEGLSGPPLTQNYSNGGVQGTPQQESGKSRFRTKSSIDWNFISAELGFAFGIGIIVLPLIFWKPWRIWYWEHVDTMLYRIFPQLDLVYECRGGQKYRILRWKFH